MMSPGADAIGARRSGNGPQPGADFEVRSPTDGSVVGSLPDQGAEEVRAAVGRLRGNQPAWEALGPSGRGQWLGRLRDWLFDNDARVAELLQRETGKPWQEATVEVPFAIELLEYCRTGTPRGFCRCASARRRPRAFFEPTLRIPQASRTGCSMGR